jgi:hypothetical protein
MFVQVQSCVYALLKENERRERKFKRYRPSIVCNVMWFYAMRLVIVRSNLD